MATVAAAAPPGGEEGGSGALIAVLVVVILLAVGVPVGVWLWIRDKNKKKAAADAAAAATAASSSASTAAAAEVVTTVETTTAPSKKDKSKKPKKPSGGTGTTTTTAGSGSGTVAGEVQEVSGKKATWYSYEDNTPKNSCSLSTGDCGRPYISAALPLRHIRKASRVGHMEGKDLTRAEEEPLFDFGEWVKAEHLVGMKMPNGKTHTGWVKIEDYCGDNEDDSYCVENNQFMDLYIGCESTLKITGLKDTTPTKIFRGTPPAGADTEYDKQIKSGKCA